jgi:hypothetical protein
LAISRIDELEVIPREMPSRSATHDKEKNGILQQSFVRFLWPPRALQSLVQNANTLMAAMSGKKTFLKRSRSRRSLKITGSAGAYPPRDLASLVRGLYGRVARNLGVDPSYVSRVARSERQSKSVEAALRRELNKIVFRANKRSKRAGRVATRKRPRTG